MRLYRLAADQGHGRSTTLVSSTITALVLPGLGEAVRLYRLAADQGHAGAQCGLRLKRSSFKSRSRTRWLAVSSLCSGWPQVR